jgi:hypothetical protein
MVLLAPKNGTSTDLPGPIPSSYRSNRQLIRRYCSSSAAVPPREPAGPVALKSASPGLSPVVSQSGPPPERKKRRAKRSEEERIDFFRTDPNVAQFEPYRVLCACCNKWIRLRSNSSYCSIPWEAHRKSCLAKKSCARSTLRSGVYTKSSFHFHSTQSEALQGMITTYPQFRYRDRDRVFCDCCESWVFVGEQDTSQATSQWNKHKATCQKTSSASHSGSTSGHMPTGPRYVHLASKFFLPSQLTCYASTTYPVPAAILLRCVPKNPGSLQSPYRTITKSVAGMPIKELLL